MIKSVKRIEYLDILKGIGMILLVWGHTTMLPAVVAAYFQAFYMPLFFFASGYVYKKKEWKELAKSIAKGLLIPYLFATFAFLVLSRVALHTGGKEQVLDIFLYTNQHMPGFAGQLWFLYALIVLELVYRVLLQIEKTPVRVLLIVALSAAGYALSWATRAEVPFRLITVCMALPFFEAGHCFKVYKENKWIERMSDLDTAHLILFMLLHIVLIYVHYFVYGCSISMWADQYNSYILFYINGILGTVLWMNISKRIENLGATSKVKNVLLKIGTTTLPILIMHNVLIAVVKKVAHMPTGHTIVDIGAAVGIMVVVIALCELVIWAVGKTPLKKPFGVLLCGKW